MQENCENIQETVEIVENSREPGGGEDDGAVQCSTDFNVEILRVGVTSVAIDWQLIARADVYEIEKHHKRHGWQSVGWHGEGPATVEGLEDNFAYRLRVKALRCDEALGQYVLLQVSPEIVATTLAERPTNICMQRAIRKGQQFLVKRILRRRPSLIEYPGPNGCLPLATAIVQGENCIADMLLSAGASVHVGNPRNGRTPLHFAFYHGRLPMARLLLNKKAALEARDCNAMSPCHFAVDANRHEILKFALENGADTEARDACGWTLLLRAVVMEADVALLKLLLMHGADAEARDPQGHSCVDLARLFRNAEASAYFVKSAKVRT